MDAVAIAGRRVLEAPGARPALVGLPALVLFAYRHAVGELFGYLAVRQQSPAHRLKPT